MYKFIHIIDVHVLITYLQYYTRIHTRNKYTLSTHELNMAFFMLFSEKTKVSAQEPFIFSGVSETCGRKDESFFPTKSMFQTPAIEITPLKATKDKTLVL